mgnify:CR=1 FL=1
MFAIYITTVSFTKSIVSDESSSISYSSSDTTYTPETLSFLNSLSRPDLFIHGEITSFLSSVGETLPGPIYPFIVEENFGESFLPNGSPLVANWL